MCSVGKLLQIKGRGKALITRNSSPSHRPTPVPVATVCTFRGPFKTFMGDESKCQHGTLHGKEGKEGENLSASKNPSLDSRFFPFLHVLYYYYKSRFPRYDDYGSEKGP